MSGARQRDSYEYGERTVDPMPERTLRVGEGRVSGSISVLLGSLCLAGALAWRFPELLTTPELREVYDVDLLRIVLRTSMSVAIGFGIFGFVRTRGRRWLGAVGVALTVAAYIVGGPLEARAVQQIGPGIGVDWMALDLFVSCLVFIFL